MTPGHPIPKWRWSEKLTNRLDEKQGRQETALGRGTFQEGLFYVAQRGDFSEKGRGRVETGALEAEPPAPVCVADRAPRGGGPAGPTQAAAA